VAYRLIRRVRVIVISSREECEVLASRLRCSVEADALAQAVIAAGFEGWIIPHNFPEGSDIMIGIADALDPIACETS